MTLEYVSEVDRKFFDNNLLTKEDWGEPMTDGFGDISEFLDLNEELKSFTDDLPDDLMTFNSPPLVDTILDDYWQEFNPKSSNEDLYNIQVKDEPLSPLSSNCSETGSEGYGSASDNSSCVQPVITSPDIKIEDNVSITPFIVPSNTLPISSTSSPSVISTSSTSRVFTIIPKQEDSKQSIILNNVNGNSVGMLTPVNGTIKLNNIMQSKIKIQPKPCESTTSTAKRSPPVSNTKKPLVLTPQEFTKLTSTGALCFQPPQSNSPVAMETGENTIPSFHTSMIDVTDVKNVKRQQRMIKNRESASLSRKRKKEYLSTLEDKINSCTSENQKLRQENDNLRKKVCVLQTENERLRLQSSYVNIKKTTTCLLAIMIMLGFNIAPWSLLDGSKSVSNDVIPIHKGRQLMAVSDTDMKYESSKPWSEPADFLMRELHRLTEEMTESSSNVTQQMCPTYFNKTESMLLAEQLAGWMIRHEEEKQKTQQKKRTGKKKVKSLRASLRGDVDAYKMEKRLEERAYQVQIFNGADENKDFLHAIHRRNDTFYVLSFDQDYFLVPATAHNKTMRPRMSLVMPAMTLNETMKPPAGSIGMMQIDCEVVSTQLIHVHNSVIPPHLKKNTTFNNQHRYKHSSRP
ncbi:hypothetical protein LOTGIDRAFT_236404 [Lottia gigantea]|uniref:BZIP domain-containing protein n=1 Tax=Lottia gigantea TaxID=225164 RepID=V3ZI82_LOTGI|nr:hypothetical protein LOTGIDRAFT_236404 [Lottia gigantea]ESO83907.1 hypothetical protein LOTGIDRAFT_236404 [Lottia gigantea]